MDPGYRRLFYCRYADDHLLGFTGRSSPCPPRQRPGNTAGYTGDDETSRRPPVPGPV